MGKLRIEIRQKAFSLLFIFREQLGSGKTVSIFLFSYILNSNTDVSEAVIT